MAPLCLYLRTSIEFLQSSSPLLQKDRQMGRMEAPFQKRPNPATYCFLEIFSYTRGQKNVL